MEYQNQKQAAMGSICKPADRQTAVELLRVKANEVANIADIVRSKMQEYACKTVGEPGPQTNCSVPPNFQPFPYDNGQAAEISRTLDMITQSLNVIGFELDRL